MTEKLLNRFINYVKINTESDSHSQTYPSSSVQIAFAKQLVEECKAHSSWRTIRRQRPPCAKRSAPPSIRLPLATSSASSAENSTLRPTSFEAGRFFR